MATPARAVRMIGAYRNASLIAFTEIQRTLITKKGLISITAFILVWLVLLLTLIRSAPQLVANGAAIGSMLGAGKIASIGRWQVPEFGLYWIIALYIFPLCGMALSADQTASDKTRGTLKLLTLHTSRTSLFFGRFTGLLLLQGLLLALTLVSTIVVAVLRDTSLLQQSINDTFFIWVNVMIVLAPYTALMALISLLAKSGMQAINYTAIIWILLFIVIYWLSTKIPQVTALKSIFPGAQISNLITHNNWSSLSTTLLPLVQTLIFLTIGLIVIHRIDL